MQGLDTFKTATKEAGGNMSVVSKKLDTFKTGKMSVVSEENTTTHVVSKGVDK